MAAIVISSVAALGAGVMAVSHMGVAVPVVERLAPGPPAVVWPPAILFTVAALAHLSVVIGALRHRQWTWAVAVVVNGLTLVASGVPFRGPASAVGIVVSLAVIACCTAPAGRRGLTGA